MATVTDRATLIEYAKRQLGAPLVNIDVTVEQCDDLVDNALSWFRDYYFDGIEKMYLKYQVTDTDVTNKYITLPDLIFGVNRVFPVTNTSSAGQPNIFDLQYQIRMNDLRDLTSTSMIYYSQIMSHIALLDNLLSTQNQYRFNKLTNKLYIDTNWAKFESGSYLMVDCYRALDPADAPKFWNDRYLKQYVTALMKRQWGQNIKKYSGITLPGGIVLDGKGLYQEGVEEIKEIEDDLMTKQAPLSWEMG